MFAGIDFGLNTSAVVQIAENGELLFEHLLETKIPSTRKGFDPPRVSGMVDKILDAYEELEHLAAVALEEPFVGESAGSALKTYSVFAPVAYELATYPATVEIVNPSELKAFMGVRKKDQLMKEAFKVYGYDAKDHNLCDAFLLAQLIRERNLET